MTTAATKEDGMESCDVITVNGVEYVRRQPVDTTGKAYCIVRTQSAGVFAGYLASRTGMEAVIHQARRIWFWAGAASLSQLAKDGTSRPKECKFPAAVDEVTVTQAIEIIPCTAKAKKSIESVPEWTA